ncbi:alpha-L-fucosidase [Streptomyces sp. MS1.AVA.1]|uniref:alpha-L-fucosidase n=1 Tax=Streptomyces machairae TaxID=3134109 RepID=A0ABU8UGP9_9ACTN
MADYEATDTSLAGHQAPYWFSDAKFGIFIHWGVYSVPAWSPVGKQYAEWYWNHMQDRNNAVYAYHAQTYGEDFAYDDFIPMFRAERFDPRAWVELFRDAGAQYHVLTSKHHEGFALWDTKLSERNSVKMGPGRDLVRELFDASAKYTPELHRGLYFSMPEWFNPDNPWMGHAPRNPYTLEPLPYTGYVSGKDYVKDYQAPQMLELIHDYAPELLWCDIGGVNDSRNVLAEYFNLAKNSRKPVDVAVNDRAGIPFHDFTTPEYTTYANTVVAKWESSRGLDPFSYGYNRATPDDAYMTTQEVVHNLVDIVSKNGNLLLDIGPRADGTIPEIMQTRLRETGRWLKVNGEAIYDTTYWSRMAQLGQDLRFTVRQGKAFYIHSLAEPGSRLTVEAPVPIRSGDKVTLLGHDRPLTWAVRGGALVIDVPGPLGRPGSTCGSSRWSGATERPLAGTRTGWAVRPFEVRSVNRSCTGRPADADCVCRSPAGACGGPWACGDRRRSDGTTSTGVLHRGRRARRFHGRGQRAPRGAAFAVACDPHPGARMRRQAVSSARAGRLPHPRR